MRTTQEKKAEIIKLVNEIMEKEGFEYTIGYLEFLKIALVYGNKLK